MSGSYDMTSHIEKAASNVLGEDAFADSLEEDTTGDSPMTRAHRQMLRNIEGLIKLLPQYQQDKFDAVEILPGYLCWFEFNFDLKASPEFVPPERDLLRLVQEACEGELAQVQQQVRLPLPEHPDQELQ